MRVMNPRIESKPELTGGYLLSEEKEPSEVQIVVPLTEEVDDQWTDILRSWLGPDGPTTVVWDIEEPSSLVIWVETDRVRASLYAFADALPNANETHKQTVEALEAIEGAIDRWWADRSS